MIIIINMKNFSTRVTYCDFFKVFLSSKVIQNLGPQASLTCPVVHILCMAILGSWVPD